MWATGTRSRTHVHWQQPAAAAAHNDAALDPQVVVLVQPYLDFLSALQEPENQVLRKRGRAGRRAAAVSKQASMAAQQHVCSPRPSPAVLSATYDRLRHNPLDLGRHGCCLRQQSGNHRSSE